MTAPINDPTSKTHHCQFDTDCHGRIRSLLLFQIGGDPEEGASISAQGLVALGKETAFLWAVRCTPSL